MIIRRNWIQSEYPYSNQSRKMSVHNNRRIQTTVYANHTYLNEIILPYHQNLQRQNERKMIRTMKLPPQTRDPNPSSLNEKI